MKPGRELDAYVCRCGHHLRAHLDLGRSTHEMDARPLGSCSSCKCERFEAADEVEMKPGRKLDALVAEYVIDLSVHLVRSRQWIDEMRPIHFSCIYTIGDDGAEYQDWKQVPHFSTDIAAAWQVDRPDWVWEFQETSHDLTVTLYPSPEARSEAIASYPVLPKNVALVRREWLDDKASTYAWVRCLAALLAVGAEGENG